MMTVRRSVPSWQNEAFFDVALSGKYFAGFWQLELARTGRVYLSSSGKAVAVPALETVLYNDQSCIQGSGRGGSSIGRWQARRDSNDGLTVSIQLGRFVLEGRWPKPELSSRLDQPLSGIIVEGQVEPDFIARFHLHLVKAEVKQKSIQRAFEMTQSKRERTMPPPAPSFSMLHFLHVSTTWRLVMMLENDRPAFYDLVLSQNGTFAATGPHHRLAGSWGLFYDDNHFSTPSSSKKRPPKGTGTHLWLWIRRSKCSGLYLDADLRLHGRISHAASLETELKQRKATLSSLTASFLLPSSVQGSVVYGDISDMEYSALIGSFRLTPVSSLIIGSLQNEEDAA